MCPSQLLPIHLAQACEKKDPSAVDVLGLNACIECGLCSYVCPSKIPVYSSILDLKKERGK